jgi:hypothetical protein
MADNFFKVKNGLNLPTLSADPTVTPPANSAAGDMAFYNGKLYIYNGTAWGVKPGSGSTGLIVNADVDAAAAIAGTKIDPNFGNQTIQTTGLVSAATLRASTKLEVLATQAGEAVYIQQLGVGNALVIEDSANPDTTAFVVDASGNLGLGVSPAASLTEKLTVAGDVKVSTGDIKLDTAKGIESNSAASTLNIGTGTNTQTLNLGTGSGTQTVNIGTGAGTTTINIGATGDSVVISGTLTTVNTTNLDVADKNITLNKGGIAGSANGSGINIEAGGSPVASITFDQTDGGAQPQNTFTLSGTGSLALPAGTTAQRPNTASNGMIRYNSTNGAFEGYASGAWSGIGGGAVTDKVTQASHAFVVGDVLYMNGATYAKARADVTSTAEVVGMVSRVVDANNFELTLNGEVSGLTGLTAGENYFLSAATAGAITAIEPSVVGQVSLPVGVASSTTTFYVAIKRGNVVGSANARTTIGLAQSATTTVQNASAYEAGELTGWVYIDATTDLRFYVQAQFAKSGAAVVDYNLSYQTTGDTPPAGFSMTITAAGLIQVTLPAIAGFTAANINFALNAPAVGATLPLQISGANVTGPVLAAGTGTAVPAGYVGEVKEATRGSDVTLSVVAGTFTDITGLSITLEPGVWEVETFGAMYIQGASGTGVPGRVGVWQLTDNAGTPVVLRENRCGFVNSVVASTFMNAFVKIRLLVTSTTTYKARAGTIENSSATTNPVAVQVNASSTAVAVIRAVRVG